MSQDDILNEADRILEAAKKTNIILRLLGGVAIATKCPSAKHSAIARTYPDIDLIGPKKQSKQIRELFLTLGYESNQMFNALRGATRLMYVDMPRKRKIDIFLDYFEMCHKLDLRQRLTIDPKTIPVSDLLATKLQIVKTTEKDFKDIAAILLDYEVGTTDNAETLNGKRLAELCASDWGTYKTFTIVLDKTVTMTDSFNLTSSEKETIRTRIGEISKRIESEPKSSRWKWRARVGEKAVWYKLPDDMAE
jgi:hypothetical protein